MGVAAPQLAFVGADHRHSECKQYMSDDPLIALAAVAGYTSLPNAGELGGQRRRILQKT
jgi:hypothetical protein